MVRELLLTLLSGASAGLAFGTGAGQGFAHTLVNGMVMVLPFQAGYAIAGLAAVRARPWHLAVLGALGLAAVLAAGLASPVLALLPLALATAAGLRLRHWRGAAAAVYLWCVPLWAMTVLLGQLSGGANLAPLGAVYMTARVLLAIAAPLRTDPWFLPARPPV